MPKSKYRLTESARHILRIESACHLDRRYRTLALELDFCLRQQGLARELIGRDSAEANRWRDKAQRAFTLLATRRQAIASRITLMTQLEDGPRHSADTPLATTSNATPGR
jgi:hypothetical protein